jgi:hypothetical protein
MAPDPTSPRPRTSPASRQRRCAGPRPAQAPDTIPGKGISALRFTQSLLHLSRVRIELHAAGLKARRSSPDDDVAWWEATLALNRTLRHGGTGPQAAMAAHLAAQAVLAAATRTGLGLNPDVAAVARSAGEAARVLAAGDLNATGAGYLTRGWEDILIPLGEPASSGPAGGRGHPKRSRSPRPSSKTA